MAQMSDIHHEFAHRSFLFLLVAFVAYVGLGYFLSISTTMPQLPGLAVVIFILLIMSVIYAFARHTALTMHQSRENTGVRRLIWLPVFLFLFLFSGFGFISSSMLLIEGPKIVGETISHAIVSLERLQGKAKDVLRVPDYETLKARVDGQRIPLHNEIFNPSKGEYCGVGPRAKKILDDIHADLPSIRVLAGTDVAHSCADIATLQGIENAYGGMIDEGLRKSSVYTQNRVEEKEQLKNRISSASADATARLADLNARLGSAPSFIGGLSLYSDSVAALENAKQVYDKSYQDLLSFTSSSNLDLPPILDISAAEGISSPAQILGALSKRLDHISTYEYLLVALIVDLLVTYTTSIVILRHRQSFLVESNDRMPDSDVHYIWRPELR